MRFSKLPSHRNGRYHVVSIALGIATYTEEASNQVLWLMSPQARKLRRNKRQDGTSHFSQRNPQELEGPTSRAQPPQVGKVRPETVRGRSNKKTETQATFCLFF